MNIYRLEPDGSSISVEKTLSEIWEAVTASIYLSRLMGPIGMGEKFLLFINYDELKKEGISPQILEKSLIQDIMSKKNKPKYQYEKCEEKMSNIVFCYSGKFKLDRVIIIYPSGTKIELEDFSNSFSRVIGYMFR